MKDDNYTILIYIAFIIISLIVTVINNVAKKKEAEAQKQRRKNDMQGERPSSAMPPFKGPKETVNPLEEFLRRQMEQYEGPEEVKEDVPEPQIQKEPVQQVIEDPQKEGAAVFESTEHELYSDKNLSETHTLSDEIKDLEIFDYNAFEKGDITGKLEEVVDFDATEAVIYSEILKRPDY